jgi:hypothetical protein
MANMRARQRPGGERQLTQESGDSANGSLPSVNGDTQVKIVIPDDHSMVHLLGSRDALLRVIEADFAADIHVRGNEITVTGPAAETALVARLFEELIKLVSRGTELSAGVVEQTVSMLRNRPAARPDEVLTLDILSARGSTIRPKTLNQKRYVDAIDSHTVVFAIGPAGTGKTYLAMAKAVRALQAKEIKRIILTRPAVEAGERLGFLPGTLYEKIDPYLRPLYDALHDMLPGEQVIKRLASGEIEIARIQDLDLVLQRGGICRQLRQHGGQIGDDVLARIEHHARGRRIECRQRVEDRHRQRDDSGGHDLDQRPSLARNAHQIVPSERRARLGRLDRSSGRHGCRFRPLPQLSSACVDPFGPI